MNQTTLMSLLVATLFVLLSFFTTRLLAQGIDTGAASTNKEASASVHQAQASAVDLIETGNGVFLHGKKRYQQAINTYVVKKQAAETLVPFLQASAVANPTQNLILSKGAWDIYLAAPENTALQHSAHVNSLQQARVEILVNVDTRAVAVLHPYIIATVQSRDIAQDIASFYGLKSLRIIGEPPNLTVLYDAPIDNVLATVENIRQQTGVHGAQADITEDFYEAH